MKSRRFTVFLLVFALAMLPVVNAQNVHGWEWSVAVGDSWEYEMVIDYEIIQDRTNVLINVTSLSNLTAITDVKDIKATSQITTTDGEELSDIRKNATQFFNTSIALPVGNWSYISDNADQLMGEYFLLLSLAVDTDVIENTTHFGFNIGYNDGTIGLAMNSTWLKSDGSMLFYNVSFENPVLDVYLSLERVEPPEPSVIDDVIAFFQNNQLLVIGVVIVLCIIAGIANKK